MGNTFHVTRHRRTTGAVKTWYKLTGTRCQDSSESLCLSLEYRGNTKPLGIHISLNIMPFFIISTETKPLSSYINIYMCVCVCVCVCGVWSFSEETKEKGGGGWLYTRKVQKLG